MENAADSSWMSLLDILNYFFLIAITVLLVVFVVKLFMGKSQRSSSMKSHRRSGHKE